MRTIVTAAIRSLVAVVGLSLFCAASAQSPAVSPPEADQARQQADRQVTQPLNNAPVWKEIRSGEKQYTSIPGRETNVLIQPQGQTWRALRDGQISVYGGWMLVLLFVVILAFYFWKGTLELHAAPTGRKIARFSLWERAVHWTTAICFSILAISGIIILFGKSVFLPIIGHTLFAWLAVLAKNLHNFVGPLFCVSVFLLFVTLVRDNFWRSYDMNWFRHFGGLFSGRDVPSGKFNAGEKAWFWGGALFLGLFVSVSGLVLDFPNFNQTRQTMQIANVVHATAAVLFMLGALGHIYMGTLGMAGAFDAMKTGYVDETWAREHHEYWYNDLKSGRVAGEGRATGVEQPAV